MQVGVACWVGRTGHHAPSSPFCPVRVLPACPAAPPSCRGATDSHTLQQPLPFSTVSAYPCVPSRFTRCPLCSDAPSPSLYASSSTRSIYRLHLSSTA